MVYIQQYIVITTILLIFISVVVASEVDEETSTQHQHQHQYHLQLQQQHHHHHPKGSKEQPTYSTKTQRFVGKQGCVRYVQRSGDVPRRLRYRIVIVLHRGRYGYSPIQPILRVSRFSLLDGIRKGITYFGIPLILFFSFG